MDTKFLTELGLSEEVAKKVFEQHGKDVNAIKLERDTFETDKKALKQQLDDAKNALKGFEGVDVGELQGKITDLTQDLANKETEYTQKIADRDFSDKINSAISKLGGKSNKAVMAMLDIDSLKQSKNQDTDITSALEQCQKDNAYLFGDDSQPRIHTGGDTGGANGNTGDSFKASMRAAMGLAPLKNGD